jgi:hypothetical protein
MTKNLQECIAELRRELAMRKARYPQWIQAGTLTREDANHRYLCLKTVLAKLEKEEADKVAKQGNLFPSDQSSYPFSKLEP